MEHLWQRLRGRLIDEGWVAAPECGADALKNPTDTLMATPASVENDQRVREFRLMLSQRIETLVEHQQAGLDFSAALREYREFLAILEETCGEYSE